MKKRKNPAKCSDNGVESNYIYSISKSIWIYTTKTSMIIVYRQIYLISPDGLRYQNTGFLPSFIGLLSEFVPIYRDEICTYSGITEQSIQLKTIPDASESENFSVFAVSLYRTSQKSQFTFGSLYTNRSKSFGNAGKRTIQCCISPKSWGSAFR